MRRDQFAPKKSEKTMRTTNPQAGLTLVEVIVVLVIIAGVIGLVGPQVFGQLEKSRVQTTRSQIELLATALDTYRLEIGRYPTERQGLVALVEQPEGVPLWNGPYLRKPTLPKDSWGQDYVYVIPADRNGVDYELYSLGADGEPGGEGDDADIGNWQ